ncbi:MAG: glycosyl transferase group 1 [Bacteroidetes bacterium]|nr:glycosyl transferase group 1 [Bacteroidota bacterium]
MNLFLFANFFPYKRAEPFLVNEFQFAKEKSESITVITLYGKKEDSLLPSDPKLTLLSPVFEAAGNKKVIWKKGLFNLAPLGFHFTEFFTRGLLFKPKQLYWFFISLFVTRAALASPAYKELIKKINQASSPVLYFYWGDNLAWTIPYLKRKIKNKNARIVLRLHGSDLYEHTKAGYAPLRKKIFSACDQIFTVAQNGCNYLKEKYPDHAGKMTVSSLGVFDNGLNPYTPDVLTVVSASNVVALKRIPLLLEALQKLDLPLVWHHFGDGPLFTQLEELAKRKREGLTIHLHGHVSNRELMTFYGTTSVDLFVNVSSSEGLPVSIMEALSFGIPVMATDVGGTSELVNSTVGGLVEPSISAGELSERINEFFKLNPAAKNEIRKNAREQFLTRVSAEKNYNNFYKIISGT